MAGSITSIVMLICLLVWIKQPIMGQQYSDTDRLEAQCTIITDKFTVIVSKIYFKPLYTRKIS